MEYDLIKSLFNISLEPHKVLLPKFLKEIEKRNPSEYLERLEINKILSNKKLKKIEKLEKILILQSFSFNSEIFHLRYEELIVLLFGEIPPSIKESKKINRLLTLIDLIKKDLITTTGIIENYKEYDFLVEKIFFCPLKYYIQNNLIYKITLMHKSSDVRNFLKNYTPDYDSLFKENLTYKDFLFLRKNYEYTIKRKDKKKIQILNDYESTKKFKIDKYLFYLLKKIRYENIYNINSPEVDYLLIDLRENLAPAYWDKIDKFIWDKPTKELKKIRHIKNVEKKQKRINIFLQRINPIYTNRYLKCLFINK